MTQYFLISNSDGDTHVEPISEKELLKRLNEEGNEMDFMSEIPKEHDTNYWGEGVLIIKGEIVVPKAKTTITEFTL